MTFCHVNDNFLFRRKAAAMRLAKGRSYTTYHLRNQAYVELSESPYCPCGQLRTSPRRVIIRQSNQIKEDTYRWYLHHGTFSCKKNLCFKILLLPYAGACHLSIDSHQYESQWYQKRTYMHVWQSTFQLTVDPTYCPDYTRMALIPHPAMHITSKTSSRVCFYTKGVEAW